MAVAGKMRATWYRTLVAGVCVVQGIAGGVRAQAEPGLVPLFNGKDLSGWILTDPKGAGYVVRDGILVCPADGGGNLFTERAYGNFVLRFEFRLGEGGHGGVALRAPLRGDPVYMGFQIQLRDEHYRRLNHLRPAQPHGSISEVLAAGRGALKRPGEWNFQEIRCVDRRVAVKLNGETILDVDLNSIADASILQKHPGLLRQTGHIGFISGQEKIEFRNIRIEEVSSGREENRAPPGFEALFNGEDLTGWRGWVADPVRRSRMSVGTLARAQKRADEEMQKKWAVKDGILFYAGHGFDNIRTEKEYGDFELLADWKIGPDGRGGICLRGTPQVRLWDRGNSGALGNNRKHPNTPLQAADHPVGEWNRIRLLMTGDRVTVYLNDQLVVHNVALENYWERHKPLYAAGPIELQAHRGPIWFKNIFIREISP